MALGCCRVWSGEGGAFYKIGWEGSDGSESQPVMYGDQGYTRVCGIILLMDERLM